MTDADTLFASLEALRNEERATKEKAYLKSALTHLGASVPAVRQVAKAFWKERGKVDHDALVSLVEALWARPVHEARLLAVELLDVGKATLGPSDVVLLERMLREARTWALVDPLAVNVMGALVARHDALGATLDRWAEDPDFWIRRSALLALLGPLRRGGGDFERFGRYADAMLHEKEFFVRKAIGWVLRETGKKRPTLVRDWLAPRIDRAAGLTVREALKSLPEADREALLAQRSGAKDRATARARGRS